MYAIIDIETTGGNPVVEKITEIAIFIHDGTKVIDEFTTLINPEKTIPYYITGLTGINNEMVANAPKFYEVAKKIVELTENKIFVAHNVTFDYNFVKSEFRNLGYNFQREQLCTVKLSRKLIPGKKSYSLGNLCADLQIPISDRHRAAGDAQATVKLFELLLHAKECQGQSSFKEDFGPLHPALNREKIYKLPEECGVYYLYNDKNDIIYVGKSKNIKSRVLTHLGVNNNASIKLKKEVVDISYELTGSELIALLLESAEIKRHKPLYNRKQRRTMENSGIFCYTNDKGYVCFAIDFIQKHPDKEFLRGYDSKQQAKEKMEKLCEEYHLCQKFTGLYDCQGNCFHYEIRQCKGACIGLESSEDYNMRAIMARNSIFDSGLNLIIIDKGRNKEERAIVRIKDGKYRGFGYVDITEANGIESIEECIKPAKDNHEVMQIIRSYLQHSKVEKIIRS